MKILTFLYSLYVYLIIALAGILCLPILIVILLLPKNIRYNNRVFYFVANIFYKIIIRGSLLPLDIKGLENIPKNTHVIFAPNHQSSLDIPIVGYILNGRIHIWLVLEYYLKNWIMGFFIKRLFVSVDNKNNIKAARAVVKLIDRLNKYPADLVIFPEGGRYTDGEIHKFSEGFAYIAQKTKFPVVPILMPYNYKIFPPYSFYIHYQSIKVIIGKPFIYENIDTIESFTKKVYDWFVKENNNL